MFMVALNPKSTMGPVISLRHLRRIEEMIQRSTGGTILTGGERMAGTSSLDGFDFSRGSFFPPTVIAGLGIEDELWKEEIFGPVVVVMRFSVGLRCGSPWRLFTALSIRRKVTLCGWRITVDTASVQASGPKICQRHIASLRTSNLESVG
jgi:hypothetical protein